jgi:hypothetical protein
MKTYIYLTCLICGFSIASFYQPLFIIPTCITICVISLFSFRDVVFSKTKLELLEKKVAELTNIVNTIRYVRSNATRK